MTVVAKPLGPARDPVIDVARGIAIVLVVIGHNRALSATAPGIIDALFLFHVPLFFLLSGLVQREQPLREGTRALARRLLLPFLVAGMLVGTAKCLVRDGSFGELLLGMAWGTGQTLPWSHLWFLPALFLALLCTQLLRRVPGGATRWPVSSLLAAATILLVPTVTGPDLTARGFPLPVGWPWSVDLLPYCLLFVWLGAWLNDSPRIRAVLQDPWALAVAVAVFMLCLRARVDLNLRVFAPPALAMLAAIGGCIVTLGVARGFAGWRAPRYLLATVGRHTLAIFLLHVSIQKALLAGSTSWWAGVLAAAAAIGIPMLLSAGARMGLARWRNRHVGRAPATQELPT
jgi:fucose 4-O-acetylase-like acetyltransferase